MSRLRYNSFDRDFTKMRNIILGFIAVIFAVIVALYIALGVGIYTVVNNPEDVSRGAGRIMGEFMRGMEETKNAP
jgi:hypothetical protein